MYKRDLAAGRVNGWLVACQVGGLSRFTITGVLALRLMDEAAEADFASGGETFAKAGAEVVTLADDLTTFVGHLVDSLLKQHGAEFTSDTIEVPPLLRAARDRLEEVHQATRR